MLCRRIALVFAPSVDGVFFMDLTHEVVAECFCQDGGCCNRGIEPIATNEGFMRDVGVGDEPVAVDKDKVRLMTKLIQCTMHGFKRGYQYVFSVDFLSVQGGNGPFC